MSGHLLVAASLCGFVGHCVVHSMACGAPIETDVLLNNVAVRLSSLTSMFQSR